MIKSFNDYLVEEAKVAYFTFGRMNPPTSGHEKLLDMLAKNAGRNCARSYKSTGRNERESC